MMKGVEEFVHKGKLLAVITRAAALEHLEKTGQNVVFVSPDHFPFQVGLHHRKKDEKVIAHFHKPFSELKNFPVQEFFYVISGRVKFELHDEQEQDQKVGEVYLGAGDTIILNTGHAVTFLDEATKVVELKQGPYRGREQEKREVA